MNVHSQTLLIKADTKPSVLKQRLFPICYLCAVAVAMVGWLWAIGGVTLALAKWLLA